MRGYRGTFLTVAAFQISKKSLQYIVAALGLDSKLTVGRICDYLICKQLVLVFIDLFYHGHVVYIQHPKRAMEDNYLSSRIRHITYRFNDILKCLYIVGYGARFAIRQIVTLPSERVF